MTRLRLRSALVSVALMATAMPFAAHADAVADFYRGRTVTVVIPAALVINIALIDYAWLALLLFWWLKPLFDRLPLAIVSRAFFGETPTP